MGLRGSSGHGEHSLAALVGFVEQRGQLQQELEGTVHILSEILKNTKPGTQLTMLLAQAHLPLPPSAPSRKVLRTSTILTPQTALPSHLVPLGILLEFNQHLGHLKDTGHRVTRRQTLFHSWDPTAAPAHTSTAAHSCSPSPRKAEFLEHRDFVPLVPSMVFFHHHLEPHFPTTSQENSLCQTK